MLSATPGVSDARAGHVHRLRWAVLAVSAGALAVKLWMAATTFGTNDIVHWLSYLDAVTRAGPVGVYGISMPYPVDGHVIQLYNHPPLIGYFLEAVRFAARAGFAPEFTIRATASLADVATALLVFELLRRRAALPRAAAAAVLVAVSPVLFVISGYHGNTDPVFVMLTLLSVYLLANAHRPGLGGAAMAAALGVKIVPVVVLPCLLVYALRCGWRPLARFGAGLLGVSLLWWAPALALQGPAVRRDVLGYAGLNSHEWGIDLLGTWVTHAQVAGWLEGPGRLLIVAGCALIPAALVWLRPATVVPAAALALCAFLALTPSFGTQYLAWAAAPVFLLSFWGGIGFNLLAGVLLAHVYTRWNGGLPWGHAHATRFTRAEELFGLGVWAVLCAAVADGGRDLLAARRATGRAPGAARRPVDNAAALAGAAPGPGA